MDDLQKGYKCTRPDGTDFRTGTVNYAAALASGDAIIVPDPDEKRVAVCGRGLHISPTARQTCQFGGYSCRPWRWFEVLYSPSDVIDRDSEKLRLSCIRRVVRELSLADVFGADIGTRVRRAADLIGTWKTIPWLRPSVQVPDEQLHGLVADWRGAFSPWLRKGANLPAGVRIVRDYSAATAAAADAAAAAAADADAATAAAAAAAADAATAAAADAAAAAAADAAAADAAAAAAAAADAAATAADAAAAAAAADAAARRLWYWHRWYVSPRSVTYRSARWALGGLDKPCPWTPLLEIYRLGCWPIGYVKGEFVVYAPPAAKP